jgi:hypothetical protein
LAKWSVRRKARRLVFAVENCLRGRRQGRFESRNRQSVVHCGSDCPMEALIHSELL